MFAFFGWLVGLVVAVFAVFGAASAPLTSEQRRALGKWIDIDFSVATTIPGADGEEILVSQHNFRQGGGSETGANESAQNAVKKACTKTVRSNGVKPSKFGRMGLVYTIGLANVYVLPILSDSICKVCGQPQNAHTSWCDASKVSALDIDLDVDSLTK